MRTKISREASRAGDEEASGEAFSRALPWVAFVSGMFLLNYLDRAMFGPLLPAIEAEFGISHAASTRLLLYLSLGYSASMFLSGFSSSKIRPRVMVSASLFCTGLFLYCLSVAESLTALSCLFVAMGLAAGQYFNGGLSTLRSLVRPAQWSKAISVHEIGPTASFFLAPLLAEIGASLLGWRGLIAGMGWLSMAAGVLFFFFARGGDYPAAPVSLKGFTKILREPKLWLCTWLMGLAIAGEFAPFSILTLHMIDERSLPPDTAAFLLAASRVGAPFAVLGGGWLTTRLGTLRCLRLCFAVYGLGMFCMAMPWLAPFLVGIFVQPVLTAMALPPIFVLMAESFPLRDQPVLLAVGMPIASLTGVGLMPQVMGFFGDFWSFSAGFAVMGVAVFLSFPLLAFVSPGKE